MALLLSKSDFKIARTCGTKLYYRKLRYPSLFDENPYLEFLADGGYMVETIAKLFFPDGIEIDFSSTSDAVAATQKALAQESVTLFEATLLNAHLLARVDILEKRGKKFRLIEVKAKSFDSETDGDRPYRGQRGGILAPWRPYLEDVTFQTFILKSLVPDAEIIPCLCLVDKSKTCGTETSFENFQLTPRDKTPGVFSRPIVKFTGDIDALRREPFLRIIDVTDAVDELLPTVRQSAERFSDSLTGEQPKKLPPSIGFSCKKCEYRLESGEPDGFQECWGGRAAASPHLLDLYQVQTLGKNGDIATKMIADGRCGIVDVSENDLRGKTGERQRIQVEWTKRNKEFISNQLNDTLNSCKYPLQFIDFEASRTAVPYHPGMRPYEQVSFQWSCHRIQKPGGDLLHSEWINVEDAYPNFEFARSLKRVLDLAGTIFVWSPFERSALRDVRRQMAAYEQVDLELSQWLEQIVADTGPLVDLCALAKDCYFHPRMLGSLSIKHVLPAVWFESEALRKHPWFSRYAREKDGVLLEPYSTLEPLPFANEEQDDEVEAVKEGTGAMRTYQEMMFGLRRSDSAFREAQKLALLNYCQLDTAAMVMIWMHWTTQAAQQRT